MKSRLLFDADGVMTLPEDYFSIVYSRSHGLDPEPFESFFRNEWHDFVIGKRDLRQHINEHPELWQWKGDADSLLKYWFEIEDIRNVELIDMIKTNRENGGLCYLATEQEKYRGNYMREVMFPELFDGFFITAEMGIKKDRPEFYMQIISMLKKTNPSILPEDLVFIDDSQSKVDAAQSVGIKGILYTGIDSVRELLSVT